MRRWRAGTLTFAPGESEKTFAVAVIGDDVVEVDETVEIALSDATGGALIRTPTAAGTIADDDVPEISINSPEVVEGDSGTANLVFSVTLDQLPVVEATVDWVLAGTAENGVDYEALSDGTVTFSVGEADETVTVRVVGDEIDELDETVTLTLVNAAGGATIGTAMSTGTIIDDDTAGLSIDSPEVDEADPGATSTLLFTVTLDPASDREVVVGYAVGGTAQADRDHDAHSDLSLTFAPGETVKTLSFTVLGDDIFELDETIEITLADPTGGALLHRHRGTGTIRNDDERETSDPAVWVDSTSVEEGDEGTATLDFPVKLSQASSEPVEVDYTVTGTVAFTVAGTEETAAAAGNGRLATLAVAVPQQDTRAVTGTLRFEPGETEKTIEVEVEADEEVASDGLVVVTLDAVSADSDDAEYQVGTGRGIGIVLDDDRMLSVGGPKSETPTAGETVLVPFTLELEPPTQRGQELVTVDYRWRVDGGESVSGLLTFQHDEAGTEKVTRTVDVEVGDDAELVEFELTGSTNVQLPETRELEHWRGALIGVSVAAPEPGSVERPDVGEEATIVFKVSLDRPWPATRDLEIAYVTASDDEVESRPPLEFRRGDMEKEVKVRVDDETDVATVTLTDADATRVSIVEGRAAYDLGAGRDERRALALKYILAATGRTVATNVVELVWGPRRQPPLRGHRLACDAGRAARDVRRACVRRPCKPAGRQRRSRRRRVRRHGAPAMAPVSAPTMPPGV